MEGNKVRLVLICVLCYVGTFSRVNGNIGDFDEVWKQRAEEAKKSAQNAYKPDPHNVTQELNYHVHMYVY